MSEQDASGTDDADEPAADDAADASPDDEASADGTSAAEWDSLDDVAEDGEGSDDASEDFEAGGDLLDRVASADDEQLANEIASLRMRVDSLESELETREEKAEELESKLARTKADFQNYKKRMKKRREDEKQRATEDLVERLLDVRDNLKRALEQDEGADIRDGIEATLRQFDEELRQENVTEIEPEPGQDVDPQRHEVLLRVESDQPAGTIAEVHRPGYEMADKVIRTAQVTVSEE
ncbi:nucleotide exchange factor GrpE [Halorientalis pallida]|uniref:Protein GrpE n=1 Tax=Halorientalis pallida TaxID=2479928 RepID=A0A498L2U8_9EURY|nr:nucleotide exchange factor GrpE [Halorientalis pallida]RXK48335.1 nucleotide exchange factor GrpE [Halorientalis pallida]